MRQSAMHIPGQPLDGQTLQVTFQPTFDEYVDINLHAAQHGEQMRPARRRRPSRRRWLFSYVSLLACVVALAFSLPTLAQTALSFILGPAGSTLGVVVLLGIACFVWARLSLRSRVRQYLAPAQSRLRRAGNLTITLSAAGVEAVDTLDSRMYSWRGCDGVIDTGHSIVIFMGMAHVVGAPYRAFASITDAHAYFEFAKRHQGEAAIDNPSEGFGAAEVEQETRPPGRAFWLWWAMASAAGGVAALGALGLMSRSATWP